jgi:hypothetical protein
MPKKGKPAPSLLERFMKEHFPYGEFRKAGIFTKEMKGDFEAQAKRICDRLGLKSIYEYRSKEIRCHLTYEEGKRPLHVDDSGELKPESFVTVIPSIYE